MSQTGWSRLWAAAVAACCLAVLVAAAWIRPDGLDHGTHTQLGLPPCSWAMLLSRPCPTCGMTTSFAYAAEARPARAIATQPLGAGLALLTAAGFWAALHASAAGLATGAVMAKWVRPRTIVFGLALVLAAWAYKLAVWQG
jgi:hypothetical protein